MTITDTPSVVVYGGGRMGAGIAHSFLLTGASVHVVERDEDAAATAREKIESSIAKAVERGSTEESSDALIARLGAGGDPAVIADAHLVIEAVPESWDLKVEVLTRIQSINDEALLASNTSALSIDALAAELDRPERFLGLHFFNPVPVSTLVEIVVGTKTDEDVAATAREWVERLGKTGVVVKDAPGFATTRLGIALAMEAIRMVQEGVASAVDIDKAITLGYKHPMGPLETTDIVGLDVRLAIADQLAGVLGDRFEPPQLLRDLVAEGHLGRKSGQGFYTW